MGGIDNLEENLLVIEESIRGERDQPLVCFCLGGSGDLSHTSILYLFVYVKFENDKTHIYRHRK